MYRLVKGVIFWENEQDYERHVDMVWGAVWGMIERVQDGEDQTFHIRSRQDISAEVVILVEEEVEQ